MSENLSPEQLIKKFAEVQQLSEADAEKLIGGETTEDILNNIQQFTLAKIHKDMQPTNRAQRRALAKKRGRKNTQKAEVITDMAQKLNYIDLIQKLRILNEKKNKEIENETTNENN